MAISLQAINITTTTATIHISGMITGHKKYLQIYDGSAYSDFPLPSPQYDDSSEYDLNIAGLEPGNSYIYHITVLYDEERYYYGEGSVQFTTLDQEGQPTYNAYASNQNIYFEVNNLPSIHDITYYLCDEYKNVINDVTSSYPVSYAPFTNIENGTYLVCVDYEDLDGFSHVIENPDSTELDQRYTRINISGSGPSPSGNYSYPWNASAIVTQLNLIEGLHSASAYEGWFFTFYFGNNSGTLRLYSSNLNGSIQSYIGPTDTGYNQSTGQPNADDKRSAVGNFDFSWTGSENDIVYLWVNSIGNSSYEFYLNATFSGGGGTIPTFTASVINSNQIQISVQNRGLDQYLRYYVRLESDQTDHTYDTWRDVGRLVQDDTITVTNLLYNTWYRINVGYSNNLNSGEVNWIRSNDNPYLLQTGSQPISGSYVYIYTGSGANQGWKKAVPYIYTGPEANQGWKQAQAYIFNGSAWKKTTE